MSLRPTDACAATLPRDDDWTVACHDRHEEPRPMSTSQVPTTPADARERASSDTSMQVLQIVVAMLAVIAAIGLDAVR
jgi:hypothetical protein